MELTLHVDGRRGQRVGSLEADGLHGASRTTLRCISQAGSDRSRMRRWVADLHVRLWRRRLSHVTLTIRRLRAADSGKNILD
jgi:hypothetical protein